MCSTSVAIGCSANGPSAGPHGPARRHQAAHPVDPAGVGLVELGQRLGRGAGVAEAAVVHRWATEVRRDPHPEYAHAEVRQPPGDGRHRRRIRLGHGEVDRERARPGRDRRGALPAWADVPAPGCRLPEVLGVVQPVEAGTELVAPVPVQLLGSDSLDSIALHLAWLGVEFRVLEPAELAECVHALAERLGRCVGAAR